MIKGPSERPGSAQQQSVERHGSSPTQNIEPQARPEPPKAEPLGSPKGQFDHSKFEKAPPKSRPSNPEKEEVSQGMISRLFSWLFGSQKVKTQMAPQASVEEATTPVSKKPSFATSNMLSTLDGLAKHLAKNPLGQKGGEALSLDGLMAHEKKQHLDQIKSKGSFHLNELQRLSPSDQFQIVLLLARELKKTTGTPLSQMPEPEPQEGDLSLEPPQLREALKKIRTLGTQTKPLDAQNSIKEMAASLVRSHALTAEQLAPLLYGALGQPESYKAENEITSLRNQILAQANQLPEPTQRATASPQNERNATILQGLELVRSSDRMLQEISSGLKRRISGPGDPDVKVATVEGGLAALLQNYLDAFAKGALSKQDVQDRFETAFRTYDAVVQAVSEQDPEVAQMRPEKMLAMLDKVPD